IQKIREKLGVHPVYKRIDTCAAEFASPTAYMYSTYEVPFAGQLADEAQVSARKKVVILGGGPNRIGQGIEFDYCCCHACFALAGGGPLAGRLAGGGRVRAGKRVVTLGGGPTRMGGGSEFDFCCCHACSARAGAA